MDPKETQLKLETKLVDQTICLLEKLVHRYGTQDFVVVNKKKCELSHIQESVKIAHQLRSLIGNPEPVGVAKP